MKYVEIDERTGEVHWDDYFDYLSSAKQQFPPDLYAYAIKWEHYSLDGPNTLHDAWLTGAHFPHDTQDITLEFLGARHDRRLSLRYLAVESYMYRFGDRDVFVHEFSVEGALISHEIIFSNRKSILVRAGNVIPTLDPLS